MVIALLLALASSPDYGALMAELQQLKASPLVEQRLEADLALAHRLSSDERALDVALREAEEFRSRAQQARRTNSAAVLAIASGDRVLRKMARPSEDDPAELERLAADRTETAKDLVVRLVLAYREVASDPPKTKVKVKRSRPPASPEATR